MDVSAIVRATETDLRDMGRQEKGHIICLKTYSMKEFGNNREKDELCRKIRRLQLNVAGNSHQKEINAKKQRISRLKNWGTTVDHTKQFVLDGCIQLKPRADTNQLDRRMMVVFVKFHHQDNMEKVIDTAKQIFFPNSQNSFQTLTSMSAKLGNFQGEPITECTISIQNYIKKHYLSKTRLYLLTSVKSSQEIIKGILDDSGSDSEFEFLPSSKPSVNKWYDFKHRGKSPFRCKRRNKMQRQFAEYGKREFLQNRVFWRKVI